MKLYILFGQRKESYEGEHAPEALVCWEEYAVDGNIEGFDLAVSEAKAKYGPDMSSMRVIKIDVDQDRIRDLLVTTPTLPGKIVTRLPGRT